MRQEQLEYENCHFTASRVRPWNLLALLTHSFLRTAMRYFFIYFHLSLLSSIVKEAIPC